MIIPGASFYSVFQYGASVITQPTQSFTALQAVHAAHPTVHAAHPSEHAPHVESVRPSEDLPPQATNAVSSARQTISNARYPLFMRVPSFAVRNRTFF